jgi:hypothetical protein
MGWNPTVGFGEGAKQRETEDRRQETEVGAQREESEGRRRRFAAKRRKERKGHHEGREEDTKGLEANPKCETQSDGRLGKSGRAGSWKVEGGEDLDCLILRRNNLCRSTPS